MINKDMDSVTSGMPIDYDLDCIHRMYDAGGFGGMAYTFQWTQNEIFSYLGAQYFWNIKGVPGINNTNQTDFLYYSYKLHYGDEVGQLVSRAIDEGASITEAMMLDGVYSAQYPSTGMPLYRDLQYVAILADNSWDLARHAYNLYTGREPDLYNPEYLQEKFRWDGFDAKREKLFNAERLRQLCVSAARAQEICKAAMAHRKAQKLLSEGAIAGDILSSYDEALEAARANQKLYCINYDDDYDWTDGQCTRMADELESIRNKFIESVIPDSDLKHSIPDSLRNSADRPLNIAWEKLSDIVPGSDTAKKPGHYISVDLGLNLKNDVFKLGVVLTIKLQINGN